MPDERVIEAAKRAAWVAVYQSDPPVDMDRWRFISAAEAAARHVAAHYEARAMSGMSEEDKATLAWMDEEMEKAQSTFEKILRRLLTASLEREAACTTRKILLQQVEIEGLKAELAALRAKAEGGE